MSETGYAARAVRDFLACLYPKEEAIVWAKDRPPRVQVTNGQVTSQLGKAWKLYGHFNKWFCEGHQNKKNRDDHRHHALDAVIVALTTPGLVTYISSRYNDERKKGKSYEEIVENLHFKPPWQGFHEELRHSLSDIIVSYRVNAKTTGALSDQNQLGRRKNIHGEEELVRRQQLEKLNPPISQDKGWRSSENCLGPYSAI